jgi:D-serine deaminase-like pyridoxal phosphate-dependent protein
VTELDLETPAAVVEVDRLEHNLARWRAVATSSDSRTART